MARQLKFVKPEMDNVTADVTITKLTGAVDNVYRPRRVGDMCYLFIMAPMVKAQLQKKIDTETEDEYYERTQTIKCDAEEGEGYLITEEVCERLGFSLSDLQDACAQQAHKDREIMEDQVLIPGIIHPDFTDEDDG